MLTTRSQSAVTDRKQIDTTSQMTEEMMSPNSSDMMSIDEHQAEELIRLFNELKCEDAEKRQSSLQYLTREL